AADDDLIGHQISLVDDRLGALAQRGAGGGRRAQHVAGGKLPQPPLLLQDFRLRAFPGTGWAKDDQVHKFSRRFSLKLTGKIMIRKGERARRARTCTILSSPVYGGGASRALASEAEGGASDGFEFAAHGSA